MKFNADMLMPTCSGSAVMLMCALAGLGLEYMNCYTSYGQVKQQLTEATAKLEKSEELVKRLIFKETPKDEVPEQVVIDNVNYLKVPCYFSVNGTHIKTDVLLVLPATPSYDAVLLPPVVEAEPMTKQNKKK